MNSRMSKDNREEMIDKITSFRDDLKGVRLNPLEAIKYERDVILKKSHNLRYGSTK